MKDGQLIVQPNGNTIEENGMTMMVNRRKMVMRMLYVEHSDTRVMTIGR